MSSIDLGRGHPPLPALRDRSAARSRRQSRRRPRGILDPDLLRAAIPEAFRKLDPRQLIRNPVMFVVEITAVLVTLIAIAQRDRARSRSTARPASASRSRSPLWLWFTVLFATYAEAVAEARGRAQAATLRKTRSESIAHRRRRRRHRSRTSARPSCARATSSSSATGETIPGDGDVIEGVGLRQRGRHHRRVGAGPQGARHRHPQLRDRRHDRSSATSSSSASRPIRARRSSTG